MPKNSGSTPKYGSSGRKIGTKMTVISLLSRGQPSRKKINCVMSIKVSGVRWHPSTKALITPSPPSQLKIDENSQQPTNS